MRRIGLTILFVLLPMKCLAAPWGDYKVAIGDGYHISVYTEGTSCDKDNRAVLQFRSDERASRSIARYAATRRHIFVAASRLSGENAAASRTLFVICKDDDSVIGPLSESEFEQHPIVRASGSLNWRVPQNPHPYRGILLLLGGLCLIWLKNATWLWVFIAAFFLVAMMLVLVPRHLRNARREASP